MSSETGESRTPLTREACLAYFHEEIFRLRPEAYRQTYPKWPGAVGLEIEMLPVVPGDGSFPGLVSLHQGDRATARLLREGSNHADWTLDEAAAADGHPAMLMAVRMDHEDSLTFEPGGQLEFSSKPYPCLKDALQRMRDVQGILDGIYARHGMALTQVGINPWHTVEEIGLQMTKSRYQAMNRYYGGIGPYGQRMMRQTCTVQVNLDFGESESMLARRYLASMLIAPFAAAIFAYSPVVDRHLTGIKGFRSRIWRHTDPTHTGLPGLTRVAAQTDRVTCIASYFDFAMAAHVVFVEALDYRVLDRPVTFGEWLDHPIEGVRPTKADLVTHLSLLFPEVRPRGFLELRSVDCQARAWQTVPAAFYTGLLYDPQALDLVIERLSPYLDRLEEFLVAAERGLSDPTIASLSQALMTLAQEGFARLSSCYREGCSAQSLAVFAQHFTARGRTPADDVIDQMRAEGYSHLTYAAYRALEERWAALCA